MTNSKQPSDPLTFLNKLAQRVEILERARRLPSLIGAQVSKNSGQAITTGAGSSTQVTFASPTDFDTDNFFDDANDQMVIPADLDGYYLLYGKVQFATGTGDIRIRPRINGTAFAEFNAASTAGIPSSVAITPIIRLMAEGDTFQIWVAHNQGTNRNVDGDGTDEETYFGLQFLGR